jgi:hypothetical protein
MRKKSLPALKHCQRLVLPHATAYRFARDMGYSNNFGDETENAGCCWLNISLRRNPELSVCWAEGLPLSRAQGMNRQNAEICFMIEKVVAKNNIF